MTKEDETTDFYYFESKLLFCTTDKNKNACPLQNRPSTTTLPSNSDALYANLYLQVRLRHRRHDKKHSQKNLVYM